MLDRHLRPLIDPPLARGARLLARRGVRADHVTLTGMVLALAAAGAILAGQFWLALALILGSRLADGLDGALARLHGPSDFGGILDIVCDFVFYGAVPLAFVLLDPVANGPAGAFLLASFYVNAGSFLGFAILAERRGMATHSHGVKSLYFTAGLLEGTETILLFVLLCLLPHHFAILAWAFGVLCLLTATGRMMLARRVFSRR